MQKEFSKILRHFETTGYIQMQRNWVPYEMKRRDIERRFSMSQILLERYEMKSFLHRIITGNEKLIHYDKKSMITTGQLATSMPKPNLHVAKVMLCIWWHEMGAICYELLKPGQTKSSIIFHHANARPHVAVAVKNYLENSGW